jgi:histidyl-tRNA synthetase
MVAAQGGLLKERMELCALLWKNNIPAELLYKNKAQMKQQLSKADELGCPFAVIIGENELADGVVQVKNLKKGIYFCKSFSWSI